MPAPAVPPILRPFTNRVKSDAGSYSGSSPVRQGTRTASTRAQVGFNAGLVSYVWTRASAIGQGCDLAPNEFIARKLALPAAPQFSPTHVELVYSGRVAGQTLEACALGVELRNPKRVFERGINLRLGCHDTREEVPIGLRGTQRLAGCFLVRGERRERWRHR
jgi:hypothetical protein